MNQLFNKRELLTRTLATSALLTTPAFAFVPATESFKFRYMLASSMYGKIDVLECIKQVKTIGDLNRPLASEPRRSTTAN